MTSLDLLMTFLNQAYDEAGLCWESSEYFNGIDEKILRISIGGKYGLDLEFNEEGKLKD